MGGKGGGATAGIVSGGGNTPAARLGGGNGGGGNGGIPAVLLSKPIICGMTLGGTPTGGTPVLRPFMYFLIGLFAASILSATDPWRSLTPLACPVSSVLFVFLNAY